MNEIGEKKSSILLLCLGFDQPKPVISGIRVRDLLNVFRPFGSLKKIMIFSKTTIVKAFIEFADADIAELVKLLHHDAVQSMPPFAMWLRGAENIGAFMVEPGPSSCADSKLVATSANGLPAFAQYKPETGSGYTAWGIHALEIRGGRIAAINTFLDVERVFPTFGLALTLPAG